MRKPFGRFLLLLFSVALLLSAVLPGLAQAEGEPRDKLKVGYVVDRAPVSFTGENGELAGISRYIFDEVAALSGLEFEYVPLPSGSVTYDYLLSEGFDLVTSVEFNEENKHANGIMISDPYFSCRKVIVARPSLKFDLNADLTVAVSTGSQTLRKVLSSLYPHFTLEDYDSLTDCFDAVKDGRADLMIQNQYVVEYWFSKPAYEDLRAIPVLDLDEQLCFSAVVSFDGREGPTPEEGQALIDTLDDAIARLSSDQVDGYTIQALMENQYNLTLSDFFYRYRYPAYALVAAALVILVMAVLLIRQRLRSMEARADAKVKGQFLSTMSHEIRTPLNGLIGLNYLMAQNLDDRERVSGYLRQSTVTAKYLLSLISDVLDMSQLQEGQMTLVSTPMDLDLLISAASAVVRGAMTDKGLDFRVEAQLPFPCVTGDEGRIQQVLMNLLDNARKFTPAGGHVLLKVEQRQADNGDVITRMEVVDDGQGMSQEFQKQVFHTFAQELDTVSKGNQGTGLGLPICRSLAEAMGGSLSFSSQRGKGSSFVFSFPGKPAQLPAAEPAAPAGDKPRILVAEDNDLNREIMQELLEGEGYELELAENGREALELFQRSPVGYFGVILMDLLMPEMDGYQAAAAIRGLNRADAGTVRIIACTANAFSEDRSRALGCGMDDFIPKPINIQDLLQKLTKGEQNA